MSSVAKQRGMSHFGWQLFVALMTADINKSDLPENRPQAKQHKHCPKCNSVNVKREERRYSDLYECQNCGHIFAIRTAK